MLQNVVQGTLLQRLQKQLPDEDPYAIHAVLKAVLESSFMLFVRYFFEIQNGARFNLNHHHQQIADALMRCHRHECSRLLINIPPRYSKTELTVVMFIAWCLAKRPNCQFIHLSYSDELALEGRREGRQLNQATDGLTRSGNNGVGSAGVIVDSCDRESRIRGRRDNGILSRPGTAGNPDTDTNRDVFH